MNIKDLIDKYKLTPQEYWQLPQNKYVNIISHNACEKIASIEDIRLTDIQVLNSEWNFCRLIITMKKESLFVKSIGEALLKTGDTLKRKNRSGTPEYVGNCDSQYIGCMAEKRGIDRCILKLINAYEYGIYSETEADDFDKSNCNSQNANKKIDEAGKQLDNVMRDDKFEADCKRFIDRFGGHVDADDLDDFALVESRNLDRVQLNAIISKFLEKYK